MWYVIQTLAGREHKTLEKIEHIVDASTYDCCVVPTREQPRHQGGVWKTRKETLFPGYLLVQTKTPESFMLELRSVTGTTKMLTGKDESEQVLFLPLSPVEEKLITGLMGAGASSDAGASAGGSTVRMSIGVIEGERIIVTQGPLMGHEGLIKKIDRHKRVAFLELNMFGRMLSVKVGLEIVEKR